MPPKNASPVLVKRWNTFAEALRKHEDGHRDIAVEAARVVTDRAGAARPEPDCATLKKRLERMADDTLREYRDKESSYDVTTLHGQTQGATFQ
jgi:predicted secreted Zn-dependent protease